MPKWTFTIKFYTQEVEVDTDEFEKDELPEDFDPSNPDDVKEFIESTDDVAAFLGLEEPEIEDITVKKDGK
jgi:hypothetical protein